MRRSPDSRTGFDNLLMRELTKVFDHATVDPKWYAFWEELGAFRADPSSDRPPFSMVLPPPNVTGWLHIGHALNQTVPDVVARWKRMLGYDVLWLPGTDHAGIATQNVVEKQLAAENQTRHDLGREAFEARVWEWVKKSHGTITSQMRQLGSSVDWSRERFTLDDSLSRAVRRVFVTLHREGLIYRGTYLVSWCPRCRTALSDLEVVHRDTKGKLYQIQYPYTDGQGAVVVATTRPETMLGDTAVAVHPDDPRYDGVVGRSVRLPVLGRELPFIRDDFVDPEFGTGAVKVTPAHDPNDFEMGQRHDLPQVSVIDEDGKMTAEAGPYAGQDRFVARRALVQRLEEEGLLVGVDDHMHAVGHCQRCGTVIEPLLSTQWFVKIKPLADRALEVVDTGQTEFVPANWTKTYNDWMTNIHDWCISRQLWWGHRIPAWYCDACGELIVAEETPSACSCGGTLRQDTDVLDTWFSSGLWPFSTMGWPTDTPDLARYYPTTLLITAHDIIFFWVARMMMLGVKFAGDVPFKQVYITSLVRDAHGQKMSKSKGNVVDPLELIGEIGADAFRFTLAALASPGMDISLSEGRLRGYRQFINKIWNASRFVLMNLPEDLNTRPELPDRDRLDVVHRWMLHRTNELSADVNAALESFRFDVAADRLYHVFWHEYADWYIELVKSHLQADGSRRDDAVAVLLEGARPDSSTSAPVHPLRDRRDLAGAPTTARRRTGSGPPDDHPRGVPDPEPCLAGRRSGFCRHAASRGRDRGQDRTVRVGRTSSAEDPGGHRGRAIERPGCAPRPLRQHRGPGRSRGPRVRRQRASGSGYRATGSEKFPGPRAAGRDRGSRAGNGTREAQPGEAREAARLAQVSAGQ